ncbi:SMP-30/Gluconolaconase/LRE-like region [Geosmithia morbida]|uniref:SMP-30/Gluconolaconase/LRE-like region n=1 Tax=Geosmithia morbida TaxID=1094350 RepID=A0A9P4YSC0_9HYPO|nr:SMP-30/Gluconolaconase/LRE-like region [Geosmithia morbida]KAF4120937.1 SMP-30/Gluconolaconase/LRE-like region [Geosmithia morbida]
MSTKKEYTAKVLTDGLYFGESPRYRDGKLVVSDMIGRKIYSIDPDSGNKEVLLELYEYKDGKSELYADMSGTMTGYCGDMAIDKSGRVFLDDTGARVLHGETPRVGRLLRIDPDHSVHKVEDKIVFPNALCISADGKTLYNAETFGYGLLKFDLAEDGSLSNRQKVRTPASVAG